MNLSQISWSEQCAAFEGKCKAKQGSCIDQIEKPACSSEQLFVDPRRTTNLRGCLAAGSDTCNVELQYFARGWVWTLLTESVRGI